MNVLSRQGITNLPHACEVNDPFCAYQWVMDNKLQESRDWSIHVKLHFKWDGDTYEDDRSYSHVMSFRELAHMAMFKLCYPNVARAITD